MTSDEESVTGLGSLDLYRLKVSKRRTLTDEEIAAKIRAFQEHGDERARNTVVEHYLSLALRFARRYQRRGIELEDLIQACNIGLIETVRDYNPALGAFEAYAVGKMRKWILETFRSNQRLSRPVSDDFLFFRKINDTIDTLQRELKRRPTEREIAKALKEDLHKVRMALIHMQVFVSTSLDTPFQGENADGGTIEKVLGAREASLTPEEGVVAIQEIGEIIADFKLLLLAVEHSGAKEEDKQLFKERYGLDTGTYEFVLLPTIARKNNWTQGQVDVRIENLWRRVKAGGFKRTADHDQWLRQKLMGLQDLREITSTDIPDIH